MKLSEIREAYEELSGSLSKFNRQLAFAGIGIVWLFRVTDSTGNSTLNPKMLTPILCFVISFAFDLLQYLYLSIAWYIYYWCQRDKGTKEDIEVNEPEYMNIPAWIMWFLKVVALIIAYCSLGVYLYSKLISC